MADNGQGDRLDDWFDEPEPADAWSTRVERMIRERTPVIDDWVAESAPRPAADRTTSRRPRARLLLAGLGICLLLGVLAAAGAFSGGRQPHARASITTPTTPAPPATTTAVTTAASLPVPRGTLKPGATGATVRELQRALARAGYSVGTIDGNYGPATTAAVSHFQSAHRLTADGVAGPNTLTALAAAVQAGTG